MYVAEVGDVVASSMCAGGMACVPYNARLYVGCWSDRLLGWPSAEVGWTARVVYGVTPDCADGCRAVGLVCGGGSMLAVAMSEDGDASSDGVVGGEGRRGLRRMVCCVSLKRSLVLWFLLRLRVLVIGVLWLRLMV